MFEPIALPTVGRIVYYHELGRVEPWPAMVVEVEENRHTIKTLHVFLHDGIRTLALVRHISEPMTGPANVNYWDWMPYQKGQAAKTEALQAELDAKMAVEPRPGYKPPEEK